MRNVWFILKHVMDVCQELYNIASSQVEPNRSLLKENRDRTFKFIFNLTSLYTLNLTWTDKPVFTRWEKTENWFCNCRDIKRWKKSTFYSLKSQDYSIFWIWSLVIHLSLSLFGTQTSDRCQRSAFECRNATGERMGTRVWRYLQAVLHKTLSLSSAVSNNT